MNHGTLSRSALSLMLLLCSGPAWGQSFGPRALLRVRAEFNVAAHGLRLMNQDLFVARDRSVLANLVANATHISTENYWRTQRLSVTAPPAAYRELHETLAEVNVGQRDDHCTVIIEVFPVGGSYEITWYGVSQRRTRLLLEVNGSSPLCPPELADLVNAINRFARAAGITEFGVPGEAGL